MKTRMKEHVLASRKEKGAAMVVGLLMITVLSIVGVNGAKEIVVQQRMANNYRFAIEAMNNAEAGITSAISQLNNNELGKNGFDDELDPNGDGDTSDALVITLNDPNSNMSYVVLLVDDDDGDGNLAVDSNNIIRLVSQGISDIGSTRTLDVRIEANLGAGPGVSIEKAILAAESITFSGNSAYGGDPMGGGTVQSNADVAEIPRIDPSDFEEYADYIFKSNGKIYNADGVMVGTNEYGNWKFGGDKWTTEGDDNVLGGMLYFQGEYGNVNVGSNPGTGADPWVVSILADGYIEISGNPTIDNHMDPDDPPSVQAILFMSGTDVKINGNPGQTFTGLIAAHEQFSVSGNPELQAAIIAEGAASTSDLVVQNEVSGDMSLCYDGDFTIPGSENTGDGTARIISWRDVELARGAGVFANTQQRYDY
jgi:Tfp pilus assembly protein PilX